MSDLDPSGAWRVSRRAGRSPRLRPALVMSTVLLAAVLSAACAQEESGRIDVPADATAAGDGAQVAGESVVRGSEGTPGSTTAAPPVPEVCPNLGADCPDQPPVPEGWRAEVVDGAVVLTLLDAAPDGSVAVDGAVGIGSARTLRRIDPGTVALRPVDAVRGVGIELDCELRGTAVSARIELRRDATGATRISGDYAYDGVCPGPPTRIVAPLLWKFHA